MTMVRAAYPDFIGKRGKRMPAKSEKQRKFMGAELARKRAGKKTRTGMSEEKLSDFSSKPKKQYKSHNSPLAIGIGSHCKYER